LSSADQRLTGRGIKDADFRLRPFIGAGGKEQWGTADYTQVMLTTWEDVRWDYWRPSGGAKGKEPIEKWGETALKEWLQTITASYTTETPELTPVFAYYGASRGRIEVPERLRSAKHNYEHPTAALVDCFNPNSDFREMLAWYDLEESSELRENKNVTDDDYAPFETLEAVRATVLLLLGGVYRNPHFNHRHKFMLERASDRAPLLVNQLSQGYQSMLAMAMDFARRLAIGNSHLVYGSNFALNQIVSAAEELLALDVAVKQQLQDALAMSAPAIMLVDEIDLHLHPEWQQRVLDDLMRTFPLTQFIVTTHSPQVLTSVDASCIRKLVSVIDEQTGKSRVSIEPVTHQTRGVASADALASIMGVNPIPDVPEAKTLSAYHALIQQNLHDSGDGRRMRAELDMHFSSDHPVMLDCDRMIRLQAFKQRLPAPRDTGEGNS